MNRKMKLLWLLLVPVIVFIAIENYTHLLSQMWTGPVYLNIIFYYLIFALLSFITGSTAFGYSLAILILMFAGILNCYVIRFRSVPVFPWDIYSIKTAVSVADNFDYKPSLEMVCITLVLMMILVISIRLSVKIKIIKWRMTGAILSLSLFIGMSFWVQTDLAAEIHGIDTTLFTPKVFYRNNGLVLSFIRNMKYLTFETPEDYSNENVRQTIEACSALQTEEKNTRKPNIIVVMNEAFSDLNVLGDYATNKEVMPFIQSLSEETRKGYMYASVKGGNTANTEFEFLTGASMHWMPIGSVPYQQFIREETPTIASQLHMMDYKTIAIHPYYKTGWCRDTVYDYFGFDKKIFIDQFQGKEKLRTYISDQATYDQIIKEYEEKDDNERLFVFDVTMQNHGSYTKFYDIFVPDIKIENGSGRYIGATEQYLSLIRRSDEAFQSLVTYFQNQDEPTIILMFGDHQPADYVVQAVWDHDQSTLEKEQRRFIVPYIIWANYDIEESQGTYTSANYLGVELLKEAGVPLTGFQKFLYQLKKQYPVITANMAMDAQQNFYERDDVVLKDALSSYHILQYNLLKKADDRVEEFFQSCEN